MKINIFWGNLTDISVKKNHCRTTQVLEFVEVSDGAGMLHVREIYAFFADLLAYRITGKFSNALRTSQTCRFAK